MKDLSSLKNLFFLIRQMMNFSFLGHWRKAVKNQEKQSHRPYLEIAMIFCAAVVLLDHFIKYFCFKF